MGRESDYSGHSYIPSGRRSEGGQALLEFALVLPLLFLILLAVIFVSQAFNLQMALYGAAYEGVRIWASNPPGGDGNHCTPADCGGDLRNFDRYIAPAVRQYLSDNGFNGDDVLFFSRNRNAYRDGVNQASNNTQFIKMTLYYPVRFPLGRNIQLIYVAATCTMKRGG